MKRLDYSLLPEGHPLYKWVVLVLATLFTDLGAITAMATSIALPSIEGFYTIGATKTVWIGTSFLLMLATAVPLTTYFGKNYGFKRLFMIGAALFAIGNAGAGLAPIYPIHIFFRLLSGIGGGILFPLAISFIAGAFPQEKRALALSLYTAFGFGMGITLGVLLGGIFSQSHQWQWLFIISAGAAVLCLVGVAFFFRETTRRSSEPLDILGYITFLGFIFSGILITINAKAPWNTDGWQSNYILIMEVFCLAFFLLFIFVELWQKKPLFLLKHFTIRAFTLANIAIFLLGAMLFGTIIFFAQILQRDLLWSNIQVGKQLAPFGLALGLSGAITGMVATKIGNRIPAFISLVLVTISCFFNHGFTVYSNHSDLFWIIALRGAGIGIGLGPLTALALSKIKNEEIPNATVAVTILRQMGGAFSGNLLSILIVQRSHFHMQRFSSAIQGNTPMDHATAQHIATFAHTQLGQTPQQSMRISDAYITDFITRQAHIAAFDDAFFIFGIAIGVITVILTFFMMRAWLLARMQRAAKT